MIRSRSRRFRVFSATLVILIIVSGGIFHIGWGTPPSFGYRGLSLICPLGGLEALVTGDAAIATLLVGLAISVAAITLFGRAFCGWICPVSFWQRRPAGPVGAVSSVTSRYAVLGAAILSSAVFGFPVFCLICPVGLFFASLMAVIRLFRFDDAGIGLIAYPLLLAVELLVLRRWCGRICPIGTLLGLIARCNPVWRPQVDPTLCLTTTRGGHCHACRRHCPEGIDLHRPDADHLLGRCIKCHDCADVCPVSAIRFPLR